MPSFASLPTLPTGMKFIIAGICKKGPQAKKDKESGKQTGLTVDLTYFGGSVYLSLADATQGVLIKPGSHVVGEADVRHFKDQMYPDTVVVTHVDGKKVSA